MTDACFSCFLVPASHLHHYLDCAVKGSLELARLAPTGCSTRLSIRPTALQLAGCLTASSGTETSTPISAWMSLLCLLHQHVLTWISASQSAIIEPFTFHQLDSVAQLEPLKAQLTSVVGPCQSTGLSELDCSDIRQGPGYRQVPGMILNLTA